MKFNININQDKLSENKDITIQDACVLDWLTSMFASNHENINGKRSSGYTWISLPYLIKDMPMLRIKTNSGASKLIKRIAKFGFIETKTDTKNRKLYARPTEKLKEIFFSTKSQRTQPRVLQETTQVPQDTNHNTIINTLNNPIPEPPAPEQDLTTKITLNLNRGKTPAQRLISLYSSLLNRRHGVELKSSDYGKVGGIIKQLLPAWSEIQIAYLLTVYFDWRGMDGANEKEMKFLEENAHSFSLFKAGMSKYEIYARKMVGLENDFDNDEKLYKHLKQKI